MESNQYESIVELPLTAHNKTTCADNEKIAVLRKGHTGLIFIGTAAQWRTLSALE